MPYLKPDPMHAYLEVSSTMFNRSYLQVKVRCNIEKVSILFIGRCCYLWIHEKASLLMHTLKINSNCSHLIVFIYFSEAALYVVFCVLIWNVTATVQFLFSLLIIPFI